MSPGGAESGWDFSPYLAAVPKTHNRSELTAATSGQEMGREKVRQEDHEPLSSEDCWELITTQTVGRLALSVRALPAILPVQYYVDDDLIAICLGHHQVPPTAITGTVAAFSVDNFTGPLSRGWTVNILGLVQPPEPVGVPTDCGQPTAGQIVHLRPDTIAGQRIWLCPFL